MDPNWRKRQRQERVVGTSEEGGLGDGGGEVVVGPVKMGLEVARQADAGSNGQMIEKN